MKRILILTFFIPIISSCQNSNSLSEKERFIFEWKLAKNETLCYEIFEEIEIDSIESNYSLIKREDEPKRSNFEIFGYEPDKKYLILKNRTEDLIDIFLVTIHRIDSSERYEMFTTGIDEQNLLKAIIDKNGNCQSFYLAVGQENLVNQFFQLPSNPIAVGEDWQLDINFTNFATNFDCTNFENRKNVILERIEEGELASVKFDMREFVEGETFEVKVKSDFKFEGKAKFSISQGRWIEYEAKYIISSTGIYEGNSITKISLKLNDEIPERVKELIKK